MAALTYGGRDFPIDDEDVQETKDVISTALSQGKSYWMQLSAGGDTVSILIGPGVPVIVTRSQPVDNTMYEGPDEDEAASLDDTAGR